MKNFTVVLIFAILLLVSCGSPANETKVNSNSVSENKSVETVKPATQNPESNLLNACRVLPKEEVEKILGQKVNSANLSRAVEGTGATAALSQCTYQIAGGQTIEFFARRSPIADNTPEAIREVRETMKKVTLKDVEDVSGVGKTAFWAPVVNQLHVFAGENIYLFLTMRNFKNAEEAKTKSAELAHRAIGALLPQ